MKIKIVPKRKLRAREPIAWGVGCAIVVHHIVNSTLAYLDLIDAIYFMLLAALGFACIFPIIDAFHDRTPNRLALRSGISGAAYGTAWWALTALDHPALLFRTLDGSQNFIVLLQIYIGLAIPAFIVAFALSFTLNRIRAKHVIDTGELCWGCAYPTAGLEGQTRCPECGSVLADRPTSSAWPKRARRLGLAVLTLLVIAQSAYTANITRRQTIPTAHVLRALPASIGSDHATYDRSPFADPFEHPGFADTYTCLVDVSERTAVSGAPLQTHMRVTILAHETSGIRVQFKLGRLMEKHESAPVLAETPLQDFGIVWNLDNESLRRFIDTGGLTDSRLQAIIDDAVARNTAYVESPVQPTRGHWSYPQHLWLFDDMDWPAGGDTP